MTAQEVLFQGKQLDITAPDHVEITIRDDGKVVWINVDAVCVLRICRAKHPIAINYVQM